jgi:GMP synthase (glutamine-hydrolysing)
VFAANHPIFQQSRRAPAISTAMPAPRLLVMEGNSPETRAQHVAAGGTVASKGYAELLHELLPGAVVDICFPGDPGANLPTGQALEGYDGIAITGSGLHVYDGGHSVTRQIELARAALDAGTPVFGSCWGLQVLTVAAGGSVRKNPNGREIGFGRGIKLTDAGRTHPMYVGKPEVFNAPTVHLDEVETLAPGTVVLATNQVSQVQSAEIRVNGAVAWGVQYHPEYPLREIAAIVRRRSRRARPQSRRQAAVVALRHQPQRAGQETAHRRGCQLAAVPGAADARQARTGMSMDFRNRHVVVTGGTGALGRAVVGALIEAGAQCHVSTMIEAEAQAFPFRDRVSLHAVGDLADEAAVAKLYDAVPGLWASIHLAGGFAMSPIADTGKAALMQQVDGNLVSCFLCCRAAVIAIRRAGGGGRIVNVAARPGLEWRSGAGMAAYTASKAAVAALTTALAEEVAKDGILVNAVAPSIMDTPANRKSMPNADYATWPKVEEVAATILFLASPDNAVTRGGVVPVYGKA